MGKSRLSRTQAIEKVIDGENRKEQIYDLFGEEKKKKSTKKNVTKEVKKEKTTLAKIRDVIVSIFTIIVIISCWYAIIVKMIFKIDVPMVGGYSALIVLTGSMEPTIKAGEVIIIQEQDEYEIGDILTYREGNILVTHRIVNKTETTYTTRGDANNTNDPAISKKTAVGKTIFHIPYIGTFILFIQTPIGLFCVLAILIALKVMYTLLRTKNENLEI